MLAVAFKEAIKYELSNVNVKCLWNEVMLAKECKVQLL